MNSTEHKHQQLPVLHHNEIGCWGIGCTAMQELYNFICAANPKLNIGYYDLKHDNEQQIAITTLDFKNVHLQVQQAPSQYQIYSFFNNADILLINGNHSNAKTMFLILDEKKPYKSNPENLELTSVIFYNEHTQNLALELSANQNQITLINGTDFYTVNLYIQNYNEKQRPSLFGLILAGGASSRMQQNKSLIKYHDQAQWLHVYNLLSLKCEQTFVSSNEKNAELFAGKPIVLDVFKGFGPLAGIISALLEFKNKAILVLACDLPLIDEVSISQLITERDPSKMATTFLNTESNYLEPLITIYEPKALPIMLTMLAQGYTCPRKMLMQNEIKIIEPKFSAALRNINYPEERDQMLEKIKKN